MPARWMQPKLIKMKRERRAWARPLSVRGSGGPNWQNGTQYRNDTSLDLNVEIQVRNEMNTRKMAVPELADLSDIRRNINDPLFVQPLSTPTQRLRIYFNSQHTVYILQWVQWRKKEVRLSYTFPTANQAYQRWLEDRVRWKSPKPITITVPR